MIRASRCAVFFVDDDQRVTLHDIGHTAELRLRAREAGAQVTELTLSSQFRCSGSDGYLAWLDHTLQVRETAHQKLSPREYDFRVFDNPEQLHALIELKNRANNRSRVVAGYCWTWPSKKNPEAWDIVMPEFGYQRRWNLDKDGSLWIVTPGSVEQVGCIHTCQGLELDYVGVIIGPDLTFRDGKIVVDASRRASTDQSVKGLKQMLKNNPAEARKLAESVVKNTYRTLMTRGMKGCYVYCTDAALADHLRACLARDASDINVAGTEAHAAAEPQVAKVVALRRVPEASRLAGQPALPVLELRAAAGAFSDFQALEDAAFEWVAPPEWVKPQPGMFVAQVVGESMNRRIPSGSWCLFRANPAGSREGKVVLVQHRSIADPETGGRFTVKVYSSLKAEDREGGWRHRKIVLKPDTDQPGYEPIVLELNEEQDEVQVIAEWLMVMPAEET